MNRRPSADQIADHKWDLRKHEPTRAEIIADLERFERELIETIGKCQTATQEAMKAIETIMNDLGVPMAKENV